MSNFFELFAVGIQAFSQPAVLVSCFVGVIVGIIVGMIPGFTITMGVILVLPFTFGMSPLQGISTMVGVAVGGASGGLISATLLGIPGTPSSVATTFDGFPMARRGEPGRAIGLGTIASFVGGFIGWIVLVIAAPALAEFGLKFGPWEFFSLVLLSITMIASLSGSSLVKGIIAGLLGMLLATVGQDPMLASPRFTFGNPELDGGFDFLPVLIGLFAFSQLLQDLEHAVRARGEPRGEVVKVGAVRIPYLQVLKDIWQARLSMVWATLVGIWIGVVPAAGGSIANVLAYDQAKKTSRHPEEFGKGSPEGIIASEAANNSVSAGDLVPALALGVPGDAVTAVMLGALLVHGVTPGPLLMTSRPDLAYGVMFGYLVATLMTLVVMLVAVRVYCRLVFIPLHILMPTILVLCALGAFVLNNRIFDIWVLFGFGLLGYFMVKHDFELPAFVLGFLLEPLAEINLKRALQTSSDLSLFFTRPISALLLLLAAIAVGYYFYVGVRSARQQNTSEAAARA